MTESEKLAPESVTLLAATRAREGAREGKGALYGPRGFAPFETGARARQRRRWIGGSGGGGGRMK